jgi:hypothetical protein
MWEPVGPLPAAVYWRRRCVAMASAVTLVALVVATAGTAGAPATPVPAANRSTTTAKAVPAPPPASSPPPASTAPASTAPVSVAPGSTAPGVTAPSTNATPRAVPSETPSASSVAPAAEGTPDSTAPGTPTRDPFSVTSAPGSTTERIRPDDTPRSSAAAGPSAAVPATGPVPCTNAMLSAAAELDHPVHRVGSHPVLRLVITNTSGQPCIRDLDSARQEIVVWSADGADRLWSSNDCANASTIDLRTLVPGRPVAFAVTWGERTTTPGCAQPRTVVPAGTYRLMVRLDDLISPPTPFIRTP